MNKKSLYIHIPFCQKKCLFCSFVISVAQEHRIDQYLDALQYEIKFHNQKNIETIYIGGGTPTMLNKKQFTKLFKMINEFFCIQENCEITVEANPEGLTLDKLKTLKELGVNRLSVGIQTTHDHYLKFLGRCHDKNTALLSVKQAQEAGFDNINLDLMYSFPNQTANEIITDVTGVLALSPQHISLYSLTVEKNSRFYAQELMLDDPEKLADDYALILKLLKEGGYQQYEVSNFAKQGLVSKHNCGYWLGLDYIGVGLGAHGYENGVRYWNVSRLHDYMRLAQQQKSLRENEEKLTLKQKLYERLVFGLRMNDGVDLQKIQQDVQHALSKKQYENIQYFIDEGLLVLEDRQLRCTDKGLFVLDDIAVRLCD